MKKITASIIQGSSIGPASYVITSADLTTIHPDNAMIKYADDTYLIIPASGVHTRTTEINNITTWAVQNNLTLNMAKTTEIVIYDSRRKQQHMPPLLPGIARIDSLRVLGVTLTRRLSASDHIRQVVGDCSQSLYALRVLRHYGLSDVCLQTVFRSVVVAKLLYACTAWSGFITASDRHRVDAFLRHSKRCGYCHPDLSTSNELLEESDDRLFHKLCSNTGHSLHYLLPPPTTASQHYNLRSTSTHNRQLPARTGHLTNGNFITRLLYKDCY